MERRYYLASREVPRTEVRAWRSQWAADSAESGALACRAATYRSGRTTSTPPSEISRSSAHVPYGSSNGCPGPTETGTTGRPVSAENASAASTHAWPPIPVHTLNVPCPARSRVETRCPARVTQVCGSFAPGQVVGWAYSSGSRLNAGIAVPSGTTAAEAYRWLCSTPCASNSYALYA